MNTVMLSLIRAAGDTNLVLVDSRRHIVQLGFVKQKDTRSTEKKNCFKCANQAVNVEHTEVNNNSITL